jgi:penicillin amidase
VARDWCEVQGTPRREPCVELAAETLDAAVAELTQQSGRDVLGLRWSEAHVARLEHRPLSSVQVRRRLFELRLPVGGDTHTQAVAGLARDTAESLTAVHGAGVRQLFNLAAGGGQWIRSTGQTVYPFDNHYNDMTMLWRRRNTLRIERKPEPGLNLVLQPQRAGAAR